MNNQFLLSLFSLSLSKSNDSSHQVTKPRLVTPLFCVTSVRLLFCVISVRLLFCVISVRLLFCVTNVRPLFCDTFFFFFFFCACGIFSVVNAPKGSTHAPSDERQARLCRTVLDLPPKRLTN